MNQLATELKLVSNSVLKKLEVSELECLSSFFIQCLERQPYVMLHVVELNHTGNYLHYRKIECSRGNQLMLPNQRLIVVHTH
ncbi:MAG: hypothetical protein CMJ25_02505 [Phycisphaerae bacterium]|nr:hypothetical protein [Phycisphaerae bacterium]